MQTYHLATRLAHLRVQELQHEARIARLERQSLQRAARALVSRLTAAPQPMTPTQTAAECCPA